MTNDNLNVGNLGDIPNDKWKKFFDVFPEIETLENTKWRPVHLIAYFCKKYYETYNVKYSFKFNSPSPSKSFEVFQMKKLAINLSSNPSILRDYIDWAYNEKAANGKRRLTSISFITNEELVNVYKMNLLRGQKPALHIDRSTQLPTDYKEALKTSGPLNTYGELAFMHQALLAGSLDLETCLNLKQSLSKLKELGFDINLLEKIK